MIDGKKLVWIDRNETWIEPFMSCLHDRTLLQDPKGASCIMKRYKWFLLYEGFLHKKVFSHPLLRCTTLEEGKKILAKIHEDESRLHIGGQSLTAKTLGVSYYWPTLQLDVVEMVR